MIFLGQICDICYVCPRLILARGADHNALDSNGNNICHMMVILNKMAMFDMAFELGADFRIINVQGLSPLTVAAFLAHTEMFFHILNIERDIYWQVGQVVCAAYPLTVVDTIDVHTGELNAKSALNLIVFGVLMQQYFYWVKCHFLAET